MNTARSCTAVGIATVVCVDLAKNKLRMRVDDDLILNLSPRNSNLKMTSCEPRRRTAYSTDLRWRMVWQRQVLGHRYETVATNLNVDKATVWRIVKLFNETGQVNKRAYPREQAFRKPTAPLELTILHLVLGQPGIYLREIQAELLEATGADVSATSICRFLSRTGFTRQRMKYAALQRDKQLRSQFVSDVSIYNPDMLIFLDESGSDKRDCLRKYGYSLRGKPPICHNLLSRGEHVSVIAFLSTEGVLDCQVVHGSVNGDVFYDLVEKVLLPHLMPFDGNNPNSVVILDNCSIHHVDDVVDMIHEVGALVHFLPPYSPDYNPIESMFSKLKTEMKAIDYQFESSTNIETILLTALSSITRQDCLNWIEDYEIYN